LVSTGGKVGDEKKNDDGKEFFVNIRVKKKKRKGTEREGKGPTHGPLEKARSR